MKYIIEIENEPFGRNDDPVIPHGMDELYRAKGFKSLVFDKNGLNKLTPYTEPDCKAIEDKVWHLARTIETMSVGETMNIFGVREENVPFLCNTLKYQEAKSKFEAWLKQKDEIRVGDEVIIPGDINYDKMIITRLWKDMYDSDAVDTIGYDGRICSFLKCKVKKTGRHFDEVEELLKKMRGEQDDIPWPLQ